MSSAYNKMIRQLTRLRLTMILATLAIAACIASPSLATKRNPPVISSSVRLQLDEYIKKYIKWYEAENCEYEPGITCRGTEYKKARKFSFGDIDGDGKEDIAVLYTLEGFCCGNNYQIYLAVFLKKGTDFRLEVSEKVGGKGERGVEFNIIKDGNILLTTEEYLPADPMCCPSGKGETAYSLKNGKLIEHDCSGDKPRSHLRNIFNR